MKAAGDWIAGIPDAVLRSKLGGRWAANVMSNPRANNAAAPLAKAWGGALSNAAANRVALSGRLARTATHGIGSLLRQIDADAAFKRLQGATSAPTDEQAQNQYKLTIEPPYP